MISRIISGVCAKRTKFLNSSFRAYCGTKFSALLQMYRLFYICALLAVNGGLSAQTVSGSWYGHADVDMAGVHNNYLTELVIKQKGTRVDGIFGYYFRDKYQSFFIHGRFDPRTREITILN